MKISKIFKINKFWWLLLLMYWAFLLLNYFKVIGGYWVDNTLIMATALVFAWVIWFIASETKKSIRTIRRHRQ